MKNRLLIIGIALVIGTVSSMLPAQEATGQNAASNADTLPVVNVNVGTLMQRCNSYEEINSQFERKKEIFEAELHLQSLKLQAEIDDFQRKLEKNAFVSQQRLEEEHRGLQRKEQELQTYKETLNKKYQDEYRQKIEQLLAMILSQLKEYSKERGCYINYISEADNASLLANNDANIMDELVEYLNNSFKTQSEINQMLSDAFGTASSNNGNVSQQNQQSQSSNLGTYNLNGRSLEAGPRPAYAGQSEGRIVINITVDPNGNVIMAEIGRETTIDDASMRKSALEAARKAKFNRISGNNNQSGTITYWYTFK